MTNMKPFERLSPFIVLILLLYGGCSESREPKDRVQLEVEFKNQFGFAPSSSVQDLHCKVIRVGDTQVRWFSFVYESNTFQKITNQNFRVGELEDLRTPWKARWSQDLVTENTNAPSWWPRSPRAVGTAVFYKEGQDTNFVASYIYLWTDWTKRRVYASSAGWD